MTESEENMNVYRMGSKDVIIETYQDYVKAGITVSTTVVANRWGPDAVNEYLRLQRESRKR